MALIHFPVPACYDDPGLIDLSPVLIECLDLQDLKPSDLKAGGRTVLVKLYAPSGASCCSGQYGTFQVLNGLGGQIKNALYVGASADAYGTTGLSSLGGPQVDVPAVSVPVDCSDEFSSTDRGIAIRDRGRWYVTKLGQGGGGGGVEYIPPTIVKARIIGGNCDPYTGLPVANTLNGVSIVSFDACKYSRCRPYLYPPDLRAPHQNGVAVPPAWGEGDQDLSALPNDYTVGDLFPSTSGASLPHGLGWAELSGQASFPRKQYTYPYLGSRIQISQTGPPAPVEALIQYQSATSVVYIRFNQPVASVNAGQVTATVDGTPSTVSAAVPYMAAYVKVTLSTTVQNNNALVVVVSFASGAVTTNSAYGSASCDAGSIQASYVNKALVQVGLYVGDAANTNRLKQFVTLTTVPRPIAITYSQTALNKLVVWYDQKVQTPASPPNTGSIIVTAASSSISVSSVSISENKAELTLGASISAGEQFYVILPAGLVRNPGGTTSTQYSGWAYMSAAVSSMIPVAYASASSTPEVLKFGDMVSLSSDLALSLTEYAGGGTSRIFYQLEVEAANQTPIPSQVFGGNVPAIYGGATGVAEAILYQAAEPVVFSWDEIKLPEAPDLAIFTIGDQPPDGLGVSTLSPVWFGALSVEWQRDRFAWSINDLIARAAMRGDMVGLVRPRLLADQQDPYQRRLVWSLM